MATAGVGPIHRVTLSLRFGMLPVSHGRGKASTTKDTHRGRNEESGVDHRRCHCARDPSPWRAQDDVKNRNPMTSKSKNPEFR